MKNVVYGLMFTVSCLVFFGCERKAIETNETTNQFCIPDSLMKNISLDTVKSENVMSDLKLSGKITFNEDNVVKVFPLVSGHVAEVKVSLGDYVQKGQALATIRSSDMAGYFSDYKSAQSQLTVAKKNMEVTAELKSSGVSSEKDYLSAQGDYEKALAQFNKMSEVLKIYGSSNQSTETVGSGYQIKSPISGFIVEKKITAGMELRTDAADNLFTISDLKEVWAAADVYESDIAKIKTGNEAAITTLSYPDKKHTGKVERISNVLDPETKVMTVKIRLSNPDYSLKPGLFANISLLFPAENKMLAVSSKAILFDENKNYVVVFDKQCNVKMQQVEVAKSVNDKCYLQESALKEGDRVITTNNLFVFTALKKQ